MVRYSSCFTLTLFCCLGFEASCSLATHIQNPEKCVSSHSYFIWHSNHSCVLISNSLLCNYGPSLLMQTNYTSIFFMSIVQSNLQTHIVPFMSLCHSTICIRAAYGILYANAWNLLHTCTTSIAALPSFFIQLNRYQIFACIITEGGYLALFHLFYKIQIPLQYTSTLACLFKLYNQCYWSFKIKKNLSEYTWIVFILLLYILVYKVFLHQYRSFIRIISIIIMGIVIFCIQQEI